MKNLREQIVWVQCQFKHCSIYIFCLSQEYLEVGHTIFVCFIFCFVLVQS